MLSLSYGKMHKPAGLFFVENSFNLVTYRRQTSMLNTGRTRQA